MFVYKMHEKKIASFLWRVLLGREAATKGQPSWISWSKATGRPSWISWPQAKTTTECAAQEIYAHRSCPLSNDNTVNELIIWMNKSDSIEINETKERSREFIEKNIFEEHWSIYVKNQHKEYKKTDFRQGGGQTKRQGGGKETARGIRSEGKRKLIF